MMKPASTLLLILLIMAMVAAPGICEEQDGRAAVKLMQEGKTEQALKIFEQLASKGDTKAMVQLGIYYYQGEVVKQDYPKAMDWFLKGFKKENADAFVNIGVMHRDGNAVPQNKKIAYCIFLTTHMTGLGSEDTQMRSNSCLRRLIDELSKDDIKDVLSTYTLQYMTAYIESKGTLKGIPDKYKPSKENPALKDLDWWLDGELDEIYSSEQEKKAAKAKAEKRRKEFNEMIHTLVFQVKFSGTTADFYNAYHTVTDMGLSKGPISPSKLSKVENGMIWEDDILMFAEEHRFITLENKQRQELVYEIRHPAKPQPCDWSEWLKPMCVLKNEGDEFALIRDTEPKYSGDPIPANAPILRFKVIKREPVTKASGAK
jgi:hypothetical protein